MGLMVLGADKGQCAVNTGAQQVMTWLSVSLPHKGQMRVDMLSISTQGFELSRKICAVQFLNKQVPWNAERRQGSRCVESDFWQPVVQGSDRRNMVGWWADVVLQTR